MTPPGPRELARPRRGRGARPAAAPTGPACSASSRRCARRAHDPLARALRPAGRRRGHRRPPPRRRGRPGRRARRACRSSELHRRSNALANAWRSRGHRRGAGVGILCRNHRGFLDATFACAKLGARALYLNTDFAGPQVRDVCAREGVDVLVYDEEFAADGGRRRGAARALPRLDRLAAERAARSRSWWRGRPLRPAQAGGDLARGAAHQRHDRHAEGRARASSRARCRRSARCSPRCRSARARPPTWRRRCSTRSASPTTVLALGLGSTVVTRRRFKPAEAVELMAAARLHRADRGPGAAGADAGARRRARPPTTSRALRIVFVSRLAARGRPRHARARRASARRSTTCTARPRWPGPRSPRRRTCARRPAAPAGRRSARACGCSDDDGALDRQAGRDRPDLRRQRARRSRATPAAAPRRSSTG